MNQSQINKFLITRKVFLYETPFPTIVKKGVNKAVFNLRDEAEKFVAIAEEKAFKLEQLYMILKNEDNAVRIKKSCSKDSN